jgi:hypothetical protein
MGKNYYWTPDPCPTCGHGETIHIGKSSAGWQFSFHGTDDIRSWENWQAILAGKGTIADEYGVELTLDEFRSVVEDRGGGLLNHHDYCAVRYPNSFWSGWKDAEGYSFSPGEFS